MTVRVTRSMDVTAPIEDVWAFIADPEKRASAISVVSRFEYDPGSDTKATWYIDLPIPLVSATIPVKTQDVTREEPRFVKFIGRSSVMTVVGEHELEATETGTHVENRFVVDGKLPGVEAFFERNLDRELKRLEREMQAELE